MGHSRTRTVGLAVSAASALVIVACASEDPAAEPATTTDPPVAADPPEDSPDAEEAAAPTREDGQTFTVLVDAHTEENQGIFDAFFPHELVVHPGDTIEFELVDSGELHSIYFGTRATEAVELAQDLPEGSAPRLVLDRVGLAYMPRNAPNVASEAARQCIERDEGDRPECVPPGGDVVFHGDELMLGTGLLKPDEPIRVTIAEDIEPGTYGFICSMHGSDMLGTVTVVDPSTPISSPDEVSAEGRDHISHLEAELEAFIAEDEVIAEADNVVIAGTWREHEHDVRGSNFVPDVVTIEVGETVTWLQPFPTHPHTVSFNWSEEHVGLAIFGDDGNPTANLPLQAPTTQVTIEPAGFSIIAPEAAGSAEWNGEEFLNSGVMLGPSTFEVTFTEPGTYRYRCLMHEDMEGVVNVVQP